MEDLQHLLKNVFLDWKTLTLVSSVSEKTALLHEKKTTLILMPQKENFSALIRSRTALFSDFRVMYCVKCSAVITSESEFIASEKFFEARDSLFSETTFSEFNSSFSVGHRSFEEKIRRYSFYMKAFPNKSAYL